MKIEFDISGEKSQNLSQSASSELTRVSKEYVEDVLDEANRLEASRNDSSNHEITAAIINDAVLYTKKYRLRKRKPTNIIIAQVVAFISSVFTGGLFDTDKFKDLGYIILFLFVFLVAVVSSVFIIFKDNSNE
ncbi:hypothetical protein [uncultured Imperialibacter sp.]|uniref:hypothetical protein n=1 Tax=uncultured Imperialibacter sp. TaxID=1672639 RepID=UPI0030D826BB|tara:strand:+ start:3228 stop:3626 length:399 start_codon:yes stop_codon:yes gene_type:complete